MISLKPTAGNLIILLAIALVLIVGMPIALIWALNTLFPTLAIPYTIETWLAAFVIPVAIKSNVSFGGK